MKQKMWIYILLLIFIVPMSITPNSRDSKKGKLDLLFYGGKWSETNLINILLKQETSYRDSWIFVSALNYELDYKRGFFDFETEGQIVKHFGKMKHTEFNGLLVTRWSNFLPRFPISIAFGEGLSIASRRPGMEERNKNLYLLRFKGQKTNPILNYLMFEIDYKFHDGIYNPRLFLRLHHRSGIFGLMCPPTCGSNFVSYGFKFTLN